MSDEPEPLVLVPERVACVTHREHLRRRWPEGFPAFLKALLDSALANPDLIREVDPSWDGSDGTAEMNTDRLNEILASRPLCYFASREAIARGLRESGAIATGVCEVCSQVKPSGRYSTMEDDAVVERRVCVDCVLDAGEELHATYPDGPPEGA